MKYLILFCLVVTPAFAKDTLNDFNKKLLENFNKDIRTDNDLSLKKDRGPSRGPASVAPAEIKEEKKIEKNNQMGHRAW